MRPCSGPLTTLLLLTACGWMTAPPLSDDDGGTGDDGRGPLPGAPADPAPVLSAPGGGPVQPVALDPAVPRVPPSLPPPDVIPVLPADTDADAAGAAGSTAGNTSASDTDADTDAATASPPRVLEPGDPVLAALRPDRGTSHTYALTLPGETFARVVMVPPVGMSGRFTLTEVRTGLTYATITRSDEGGPLTWDGLLPAGAYQVEVTLNARGRRAGRYRLGVERLDPFLTPDDLEPNDTIAWERPLPMDGWVRGHTHPDDDPHDVWRLPDIDVPTDIVVTIRDASGQNDRVTLRDPDGVDPLPAAWDEAGTSLVASLSPGPGPALTVSGQGRYAVHVTGLPGLRARPRVSDVRLSIDPEPVVIAAGVDQAQRVQARFQVANPTEDDLEIVYAHHSDHAGVRVSQAINPWSLPAGSEAVLDVPIEIDPGLAPGRDVFVSLAASVEGGRPSTAHLRLRPVCGADLVAGEAFRPLGEVQGSADVAAASAGGATLDPLHQALIDGEATGVALDVPAVITVDLAGDDPVDLIGVLPEPDLLVHPLEVVIAVSTDGERFRDVAQDTLRPSTRPRPLVLPAPTPATHVRLTVRDRPGLPERPLRLGELQVLAEREGAEAAGPVVPSSTDAYVCAPEDTDGR